MFVLRELMGKLSVEPVAFFYIVTMMFSNCLSTNLLLYKACDPTGAMAQRVGWKCENETEAQHVVMPINGWKVLFQQLVPIVLVMFAGTWSDRHGRRRRPLIVLPVAGQITADVLSLYCSVEWSVSPALTAALHSVALTFTGGSSMLFNGLNSYVADTSIEEWRTIKFGMLNSSLVAGSIVGMLVYGVVMANLSFVAAYLISIGLGLTTMTLIFVFMVDATDADTITTTFNTEQSVESNIQSSHQGVVRTSNPLDVLRNCYRVLTKQRQGHDTKILCLVVLACAPLTCVPLLGEMSVIYLYLRYKFQWNEVDFSIYNAYQMTVIFIGNLVALSILSNKFKMNDALIGTIASIFDVLAAIAFLLVSQSWLMILVPPLELFRGAALSITSSIASKCVGPDELGAMNSIKLILESTVQCGILPLYSFLYNCTFETMPSAFFLISIVLTTPLVLIFSYIYGLNREQKSNEDNNKNREPNTNIHNQ